VTTYQCINCGKESEYSRHHKANKFCSNACQQEVRRKATIDKVKQGKTSDRAQIRKVLISEFGRKCSCCGLEVWQGQPIPIEVDHIDGNAGNNDYNNVRLVCANCHGITSTWKGRNRGNGRAARGLTLS